MRVSTRRGLVALSALLMFGAGSSTADTIYGIDPGAGPGDLRPNADGAATSFASVAGVLGPVQTIDFEDQPYGDFTSLSVYPGVTAELSGTDPGGGILPDPTTSDPVRIGYNTTSGGEKHLGVWPEWNVGTCFLRFTFDNAIQAFGTYVTGLGTANGDLFVEYVLGGTQSIPVAGADAGGVLYFGLVEPGAAIAAITLRLNNVVSTRDIFGVDDVSFVGIGTVGVETTSWADVKSRYR